MSDHLNEQLSAFGVAPVIVVLKGSATAGVSVKSSLGKHFRLAETAPQSALAAARIGATVRSRSDARRPAAKMRMYPNLGIMFGTVDKQGLAGLRADKKNVRSVLSAPVLSLIRPQKRLAAAQLSEKHTWGISALEADKAWAAGFTGSGVLVGHLDTGVDGNHPALAAAIDSFIDVDDFGNIKTPSPSPYDSDEHGTHTAGTIAGRPFKKGGKLHHIGVAPGAKLASALVIEGGDVLPRVLTGMDWAVGRGIRVLSMSLGLRGYWTQFQPIMQIVRSRGVLPVFAVGNEGAGTSRSPGNYPEALSVGAMDKKGNVADFSSSQRFDRTQDPLVPDIVGPGVDVISAAPGGGVQSMDGTSMATPHIAGLAALLFQKKPAATPDEVENAIFASCQGGNGLPPERANRGFPSALRALAAL